MPTHSYISHGMATLNYRTPSAATAPANVSQAHHHNLHNLHNNHHSSGMPKNMFGMYGPVSNLGPNAGGFLQQQQQQQFQHHQVQPSLHRMQQSAMYAPPPPPVQQITSPVTMPAMVEEDDDDFLSEITVQFDDGVQTLYVGPVEIIDTNGGVDEQQQQPTNPVAPPAAATPTVRSRERFQEERAIVTLEPVGGKTKSQPLPMYLQQQQQYQEQQRLKLQQKQQQQQQQKQQQQQQQQKLQQQQKQQQKLQQKQQQQQQLLLLQQQQQERYQQQLREQISQHQLQKQLQQQLTQQQQPQQKASQVQQKPRLKQSKLKPQKQQELLQQRQHQQPQQQSHHQQNEAQRIQQMRLKQQALLQQMNLMKEFSPEQLLLLQQQSTFKSLNDSQLHHNQQQQQPSRSASASSSNSSSTSDWYQTQQQILYQQQFAMRFHQQMLNNQQLNVLQNQQPPEIQQQPPPATTARSKLCVRQAPMLNFALHNVPVSSSSSSSSSNTNSQSKTAADAAVKRPLSSVVDGRRTAGKHMDPPPPVSQPAAKRPARVIETAGPIGDIAPATVLRSPPTPTQMVTIRVASEAQPQQQHQPPVLLTQLKQEPMTEEQCENNVIPDVVSSSPPPPPTPTTPLVEMKPSLATVAVKAVEPSSSANATVVMATSCTERTVAALASVMMVSNKRADDNVPAAAVDDVPVLSVAEVPHVPNGCGSSIETAREKRNSKDDEIPCPITMNGTQQCRNEEEKMQEMASPSLPVNVAVNDEPEQTKVPVKRGRGRPPKTSHQKAAPTAKVVTELSAPEETTTNSCTTTVVEQHVGVVSDLGDSINVRVESQVGDVKRSSKKKGYISVGALFASAKTARKQQNVAKKQKLESVSVATKEESSTIAIAAEPVPERTATAEEAVTAANTTAVTNAPNEQQVLAENKTEQAISTPAAACAAVNGEDDTEVNGPSNLQEEITVQPTLPTGGKTTREESVASGDGGESSVSSLTEEGVVGSGAKQSADLISGAVPDTEKESSPASDSGIESVTETGTNNASSKSKERSRSCLLSLPSSSNLEDKSQQINDEPAVVVKQESEQQKLRVVSRRQTIATESVKRDSNDDEEKIVRKGKRTMRANRKLSAKAKEAAEATEVAEAAEVVVEATDASESAENVSLSSRDELKCPKCKMQFKTDLWYRKHLLNHHDIQPEQSAQLLSEDGSSARIEDETMPSPPSITEETEPPVAVNGSANTDENCVENDLPTAETVIEAVTGDVSQNDTEPEQALIPDEAVSPKIILPAAESKVSSGRKRKSTPYGGANASKEETTSSLDATMASNGSIATEELLLPVVTNVKVEYRTLSGAQSRDRAEEEADEAEGSDEFGSSPLPSVKNRSKSSRRKSSIVTPPVVETITKVEKQDPDDADKLTPFEAAKVTVIESELTGETHYTCTICGGQFTGKSSIKEHLSTSHAAIKRRSCEYCGRTFIQTGDLTRHTRIHTGYRPFKCPVVECSFAFISSGDLHKHVRRHNQQPLPKPHVCDQCGKDFERSYDLKRHKTMHAKSEPDFKGISCGVCGKVFARQDQFRAHTYRHIGYRPYQCEICGKAFTDPSNYSKHARLHEMDGVEVVCNFCGRPFKNKSAISKHIFHCQQKTSGAARKASGSKKRGGGDTKKEGKKSRRVGMAVGYGKESGDETTMVVNPKQENVTYDEQRPIVTKRELADSELEGGGSPSAGGRTKQQKQQQQASRKRKKRRQRTPSSTEEDDNDDDDGDDGDEDSGDDFIGPSSSCDPYGTATYAGGAVKRDRRSRKLSLSQYDADK